MLAFRAVFGPQLYYLLLLLSEHSDSSNSKGEMLTVF